MTEDFALPTAAACIPIMDADVLLPPEPGAESSVLQPAPVPVDARPATPSLGAGLPFNILYELPDTAPAVLRTSMSRIIQLLEEASDRLRQEVRSQLSNLPADVDINLLEMCQQYIISRLTEEPTGYESHEEIKGSKNHVRRSVNRPDGRSGLRLPMGVEISYRASGNRTQKYIARIVPMLDGLHLLDGYGSRVYKDLGDVVEVCSPVIKHRGRMVEWFAQAHSVCRSVGLRATSRKNATGGLHFNISIDRKMYNWRTAYANLMTMFANHPEINWVFNDPSDNGSASCLALDENYVLGYKEMLDSGYRVTDEAWEHLSVCGGKSSAINVKDGYHMEIRTFQMARNPDEFRDFLDFVNAMVLFCEWTARHDLVVPMEIVPDHVSPETERRGFYMPSDRVIQCFSSRMYSGEASFTRLLVCLGLDPARYRKYVRRNYHVRRKAPYGIEYLV